MEVGEMENFVYIIACTETGEAAVVDPAWEVPAILEQARDAGWRITHALLTHHHHDHINGVAELVHATDATVIMQAAELPMLNSTGLPMAGRDLPNLRAVSPGEDVAIGRQRIRCVHTPGHTPGSQCFYVQDNLLAGDTLFIGACGRCDFRGSDPEAMYRSLTGVLGQLPDRTVLYPGHNYAPVPVTTMGNEKRSNPYYQVPDLERFVELRMGRPLITLRSSPEKDPPV
jgi:hydroxyacylglutathione hydrolase